MAWSLSLHIAKAALDWNSKKGLDSRVELPSWTLARTLSTNIFPLTVTVTWELRHPHTASSLIVNTDGVLLTQTPCLQQHTQPLVSSRIVSETKFYLKSYTNQYPLMPQLFSAHKLASLAHICLHMYVRIAESLRSTLSWSPPCRTLRSVGCHTYRTKSMLMPRDVRDKAQHRWKLAPQRTAVVLYRALQNKE